MNKIITLFVFGVCYSILCYVGLLILNHEIGKTKYEYQWEAALEVQSTKIFVFIAAPFLTLGLLIGQFVRLFKK